MADGARGGASGKEPDRGFKEVQQEVCPTEVELAAEDKCAGGYEGDAGGGDGEACRRLMVEARVAAEAESQDDGDPFSHKGGAPDGWKHSVMAAPGWAVQELCKGLWWLARCLFFGWVVGRRSVGVGLGFPRSPSARDRGHPRFFVPAWEINAFFRNILQEACCLTY